VGKEPGGGKGGLSVGACPNSEYQSTFPIVKQTVGEKVYTSKGKEPRAEVKVREKQGSIRRER